MAHDAAILVQGALEGGETALHLSARGYSCNLGSDQAQALHDTVSYL